MKRYLIAGAATLGAFAAITPASAQSDSYVVYNTIYYDSPAHMNQIGFLRGRCGRYGPQYTLTGSQSPYSEETPAGVCTNGVFGPL